MQRLPVGAATGVPTQPRVYYMGTVGGGVWKTTDAGVTWRNVTHGQLGTSSVAAIAVAESDPNVVYVGMGEHAIRGVMTSHGDGVYRSTDAGRTWEHLGLDRTRSISRIRVHPDDPDLVYVAAQGAPCGANEERGIYRSTDGGQTWERILYVDESSGASDLAMDMTNPRILYASFWDHRRLPWHVVSGGEGSGFWKSTDGGDNWEQINAKDGGANLSFNGGEIWEDVTGGWGEAMVNAIHPSPHDEATAYVAVTRYKLNDFTPMAYVTRDWGASWEEITDGFADEAWVHVVREDPVRPDLLYAGTETGIYVSFDGGGACQSLQLDLPDTPINDLMVHERENDLVVATSGRSFWILDELAPLRQAMAVADGENHLFAPDHAYRWAGGGGFGGGGEGQNPPGGAVIDFVLADPVGGESDTTEVVSVVTSPSPTSPAPTSSGRCRAVASCPATTR